MFGKTPAGYLSPDPKNIVWCIPIHKNQLNLMIAQVEQERLKECLEKQRQVQLFFFAGVKKCGASFFLTLQYGID